MLKQIYVYEGLVIESKYSTDYVMIGMYREGVKVHESITYLDEVKISQYQLVIISIEMVMGESFEFKKFEVVKTEYLDD